MSVAQDSSGPAGQAEVVDDAAAEDEVEHVQYGARHVERNAVTVPSIEQDTTPYPIHHSRRLPAELGMVKPARSGQDKPCTRTSVLT